MPKLSAYAIVLQAPPWGGALLTHDKLSRAEQMYQ